MLHVDNTSEGEAHAPYHSKFAITKRAEDKSLYELMVDEIKKDSINRTRSPRVFSPHKTTRIVQGHLLSVRDLDEGTHKHSALEDQSILTK